MIMDKLHKGDIFGEQSALNDELSNLTFEVCSKKAQVSKIQKDKFFEFFGGLDGEPVTQLKSSILLKKIWLNMKLQFIEAMQPEQVEKLEYRNNKVYSKLKPTVMQKKETPFLKNN